MMSLLCLALALCATRPADGVLELRLEGPLLSVHLEDVRVPTRVEIDLAPAEAITLRVPWLPVDPGAEPELRVVGGGGVARVTEILPAPMSAPAALVRRPLPRPVEPPLRVPPTAWWLFAAGLLAVGASRRRPLLAALLGGGFGLAIALMPTTSPRAPHISVLEVGPEGSWWVHVGDGELEPLPGVHPDLDTQPEVADWEWVIDASDPARPRRLARASEGVHLIARSPGPAAPEHPELFEEWISSQGDLQGVWRRTGEGVWTHHGAWRSGAPLPSPSEGEPLPTWLRAGAAPGAKVWIGRLSEDPKGTDGAWIRVIWHPW